MDLLKELGIGTYPQYHAGTKLLELSDGKKQTYSTAVPPFSWLVLLDYKQALQKVCPYDVCFVGHSSLRSSTK